MDPENSRIEYYEELLKEAEDFDEKFGFLMEYQRKSAQRAHQKLLKTSLTAEMGLRACLATNTKDMLVGSARFLRTSASAKKGAHRRFLRRKFGVFSGSTDRAGGSARARAVR
jgi:PHP family Zn ribbon phosphoesterase